MNTERRDSYGHEGRLALKPINLMHTMLGSPTMTPYHTLTHPCITTSQTPGNTGKIYFHLINCFLVTLQQRYRSQYLECIGPNYWKCRILFRGWRITSFLVSSVMNMTATKSPSPMPIETLFASSITVYTLPRCCVSIIQHMIFDVIKTPWTPVPTVTWWSCHVKQNLLHILTGTHEYWVCSTCEFSTQAQPQPIAWYSTWNFCGSDGLARKQDITTASK
jgi:hypothetical protein